MPIDDRSFKRLTEKNVDRAPRRRGVYALYADKTLVFLGQAAGKKETLRSRLRGHLRTAGGDAMRYKRETTASPATRLAELVAEYVKAHGKPPALNAAKS